ncbi:MAG: TIM barrel protein [Planctomycetota bacterium]
MKLAFSTVACPDWTLARVLESAAQWSFAGVELRTFGYGSTRTACDPALTGGDKVADLFEDAGIEPAGLATGITYDEPVFPPVIGRAIGDFEKSVRLTKSAVEIAQGASLPFVRVFPFEVQPGEARNRGLRRILERLDLAARTARHTGVRLLLENGGSFAKAQDLIEIIDTIASPWLAASYSVTAACAADEDPVEGLRALGRRCEVVRIGDVRDGAHVPLGDGLLPVGDVVRAMSASNSRQWIVHEWPRLWLPDLAPPEDVLPKTAERCYQWWGEGQGEGAPTRAAAAV